uniref:Uncharacterized protein n=1 Tax=Octopus bimaculoides TaxID=37653 RepID=A0A0L8GFT5_OCTBM
MNYTMLTLVNYILTNSASDRQVLFYFSSQEQNRILVTRYKTSTLLDGRSINYHLDSRNSLKHFCLLN